VGSGLPAFSVVGSGSGRPSLVKFKFDSPPFLAVSWPRGGSEVQFGDAGRAHRIPVARCSHECSAFMTAEPERVRSALLSVNGPHSGIFPSDLIGNLVVVRGLVWLGCAGGLWVTGDPRSCLAGVSCEVRARPRQKYAKLSYAGRRTELVSTSARPDK
jgi:hypothetical protein